MKALSIKEPYASLIAEGIKKVEIRTWKTKYRGKFLVHASKAMDKSNLEEYSDVIDLNNLSNGKIIAECYLSDCILLTKDFIDKYNEENKNSGYLISPANVGKYGFILSDIKKLPSKIEAKGKLSFWEYNL